MNAMASMIAKWNKRKSLVPERKIIYLYLEMDIEIFMHTADKLSVKWKTILKNMMARLPNIKNNRWFIKAFLCTMKYQLETPSKITEESIPSDNRKGIKRKLSYCKKVIMPLRIPIDAEVNESWRYTDSHLCHGSNWNCNWTYLAIGSIERPKEVDGVEITPETDWANFPLVQTLWTHGRYRFFGRHSLDSK